MYPQIVQMPALIGRIYVSLLVSTGGVLSLPVQTGGDPPSFIHSPRNVKEVEESPNVDELASANTLGPLLGLNIHDQNQDRRVFPGAASTPFWLLLEDYGSPECALMRVSRVDLSSRHIMSRSCGVWRCCCDMWGLDDGMSLVLVSLSSAF